MSPIFSSLVPILLLIPLLLFAAFRHIYRERYAERLLSSLLKRPQVNRERFLKSEKKIVMLLKISLWPALMILVGMFLTYPEDFLVLIAGMVLLLIFILQEYSFRKWLLNYLEAQEILK